MASKKIMFIGVLFLQLVVACSSKSIRQQPSMEGRPRPGQSTEEPSKEVLMESQSSETMPEIPVVAPSNSPRALRVGVWIQGTGFDAFSALGFLQELEKEHFKPVKVFGSGFGCWIAWSWSLENNGNRAEWQSFKWDHWNYVKQASLLDRLGLHNNRSRFTEEVEKHFPSHVLRSAKLQADCPLVNARSPYSLVSGRGMTLGNLMWEQFQIPSLVDSETKVGDKFMSGLFADVPSSDELDRFSGGGVEAWIVLKTQNSDDLFSDQSLEAKSMAYRLKSRLQSTGVTRGNRPWMLLDLSDEAERPAKSLIESSKRRQWLLSGRTKAKQLLNHENKSLKNFIYGGTAQAE